MERFYYLSGCKNRNEFVNKKDEKHQNEILPQTTKRSNKINKLNRRMFEVRTLNGTMFNENCISIVLSLNKEGSEKIVK